MENHFILWVIIYYFIIYFVPPIVLALDIGTSFTSASMSIRRALFLLCFVFRVSSSPDTYSKMLQAHLAFFLSPP